jgi:hypothetical protein
MHTFVLWAVLHGVISISPIREFRPYPAVKCPKGYSLWWPAGKEFENDKYAECVKPVATQPTKASKIIENVSLREKVSKR